MSEYRPKIPFTTPLKLFTPEYKTVKGVTVKEYSGKGILIFGSFKTYGGTETTVNGIYSVIDTANIETWYYPEIKSGCRIVRIPDGAVYEIIGEPENINMRNQFMKFKVRRVKGDT
ncbi:MAG: hypothetical protein K2I00_02140 [Ruminococcus sp.]|nr:hypothetical protein [Ruminococcus sp.]